MDFFKNLIGKPNQEDEKSTVVSQALPEVQQATPSVPVTTPTLSVQPELPTIEPLPPVMVQERVETGSTSTSSRQAMPTKQETGLMQQKDALLQQQIESEQKAAEVGRLKAIEEQSALQEKLKITQDQELKKQELIKKQEEEYKKAQAEANAQYEQLKGMKIKDFWSDKSTGEKIMASIGIVLGGIGAGAARESGNQALQVLQKRMDDDLARQKANIEKQIEVVNQAKGQIKMTKEQQEYLLNNINLLGEAAYNKVGDTLALNLKRQGLNDAQIESDRRILELRQKANDYKLQREEGLRRLVDTTTTQKQFEIQTKPEPEKPLTEGQAKARSFAERMGSSIKEYDKAGGLSGKAADKIRDHLRQNTIAQEITPGVVQYVLKPGTSPIPEGLSANEQKAALAVLEYTRAKLRKESGAAIGLQEMEQELNQYLPTSRDKPETVKAKRALMGTSLKSLESEVGRAKLNVPEAPQQPETKTVNGKTYRKTTGGWIEVD